MLLLGDGSIGHIVMSLNTKVFGTAPWKSTMIIGMGKAGRFSSRRMRAGQSLTFIKLKMLIGHQIEMQVDRRTEVE